MPIIWFIKTCGALWLLLVFLSENLSAQGDIRAGLLPQINLTVPIGKQWKLASKLESRQFFYEGQATKFTYERSDLTLLFSRKVGLQNAASFGYLIRLQNTELTHRFIQQYSTASKLDGLTLAHRFVFDQSLRAKRPLLLRLRYRIGCELPLQGKSVDVREFYLKMTQEELLLFQKNTLDLETRSVLAPGFVFSKKLRLELGLDFRLGTIFSGVSPQFWGFMGCFISL